MGAEGTRVVGTVVMRPLGEVQANSWNPNRMTSFMKESLKHGLQSDGWLSSQALLIWGKDDKGKKRNVIIDGEHRWFAATELGFPEGPMVFLEGLTEPQAKALTVKMNQKRGEWDEVALGELLRDIQFDLGAEDLPLDVGISPEDLMRYMSFVPEMVDIPTGPEHDPVHAPGPTPPSMQQGHVALVQLFFSKEQHAEFQALLKDTAERFGTKNVSDTTLEVFRRACPDRPAPNAGK